MQPDPGAQHVVVPFPHTEQFAPVRQHVGVPFAHHAQFIPVRQHIPTPVDPDGPEGPGEHIDLYVLPVHVAGGDGAGGDGAGGDGLIPQPKHPVAALDAHGIG